MKKSIKQLLSAVLVIAMMATLLVVPAAAAWEQTDQDGTVGSKWVFTEGYTSGTTSYGGATLSSSITLNGSQYGLNVPNGATITIPVKQSCDIKVVANYSWNLSISSDPSKIMTGNVNNQEGTEVIFHFTKGSEDTVAIKADGAQSYIRSIELVAASTDPEVTVDKEEVTDAKVGETYTLNVGIDNAAGKQVSWAYEVGADADVITNVQSPAAGKVTFQGAKGGKTTLTLKATVDGTAYTKAVTIFVKPALSAVETDTTIDFTNETTYYTTPYAAWTGTTSWNGAQHGATLTGAMLLKIPDGKKATLTVTTCRYGAGAGLTLTPASDSSETAATSETWDENGGNGLKWTVTDAVGDTTLTFGGGQAFIHSVAVALADYIAPGQDGMTVAPATVTVKAGRNATVEATVQGYAGKSVFAMSADAAVATATVANKTVTIKGVAQGNTTVYVYMAENALDDLTAVQNDPSVKAVSVTVNAAAPAGNGKIDVWDFGAEELDTAKFNNKLTVDIINSWYPGVAPGTKGPNLASFDDDVAGLAFNDGGKTASHRLRTKNTALTRYDESSRNAEAGVDPYDPTEDSYTGLLFDNGGSSPNYNVVVKNVAQGDILHFLVSANGGPGLYALVDPNGTITNREYLNTKNNYLECITFYPGVDGDYTIYNSNQKMALARIYREPATEVTVTGSVDVSQAAGIGTDYKLVFTDDMNKTVEKAAVAADGSYTVALYKNHSYTMSLEGADEYVISTDKTVDLTAEGTGTSKTVNVTIQAVPMATTTVTVSGVTAVPAASAKLVFTPVGEDANYKPAALNVANGDQSVKLEQGRSYTVSLTNANDYTVSSTTPDPVKVDGATGAVTVALALKPTHKITIVPEGLTLADLADATFVFTNIDTENETYEGADGKPAPYTYTFTGPDAIALRDGQYKVAVTTTKGLQKLTGDVKVNGADTSRTIGFETDLTVDGGTYGYASITDDSYATAVKGITFSGFTKHTGGHGPIAGANSTMTLNLKGKADITVTTCCYGTGAEMTASSGTVTSVDGSEVDGTKVNKVYTVTGADAGALTLTFGSTVYIHSVAVAYAAGDPVTEDVVLKVGPTRDYKTINAALDYVEGLNRADGVRAILEIDPGNYEEFIQIDVPNVTFKNAKAADAKLELKNKGVDIGDNEVRVTWYYGQFHDYYSMTTGNQYSEEVMKVNQENGYLSWENKGGKIDGKAYWNSTVSLNATGFHAEGIIFENSYNQYMSAAAKADTIVPDPGREDREGLEIGDTSVQKKACIGQAAAIGLGNNVGQASFDHCAFIGRQDVVFGGVGTKMAFYDCELYGGTDYIMGDMNALFAKCDLVLNTEETSSTDVAYITAASQEQTSQRGFLFWNCTVRSAVPGVETASTKDSKPGTFGRPWKAAAEAVFYETIVGTTTTKADGTDGEAVSLIEPDGWTNGLNGTFDRCAEYHTHEVEGSERTTLSNGTQGYPSVLTEPVLKDGTKIDYKTWLGGWEPFADKDFTVEGCPDQPTTDKDALEAAIAEAEGVYDIDRDTVYVLANDTKPRDVAKGQKFVTEKDVEDLAAAIAAAKAVLADTTADQAAVDAAVTALEKAVADFQKAVKTGTKGSSSNTPSGGSSSGRGDERPTETETKDDNGNTAKKTTDGRGNTVITVTDPNGEVIAKVELPATVPSVGYKFIDVPDDHWAAGSINDMAGLGMVKGVDDVNHVYDMNSATTRGAVATILFRLSQGKAGLGSSFADVAAGAWYADGIAWAAKYGVVTGFDASTFAPDQAVTREQLALMLYRYAKLLGMDVKTTGNLDNFADASGVSSWAAEAMTWAVGAGIIKGNDVKELNATDAATRAETACMMDRFVALAR